MTFKDKSQSNNLETMKSAEETAVGIAEVRDRKRPCKVDCILWKSLLLGCHQNMCQ